MPDHSSLDLPYLAEVETETLSMLHEARGYFATCLPAEVACLGRRRRVALLGEEFRVTARLSAVMAWVLYRKAVRAGEIDEGEFRVLADPLSENGPCAACAVPPEDCPRGLGDMLERSDRFYHRVARLDDMLRADV